jgi:transposase
MRVPKYFIGVDIASQTFTVSIGHIQSAQWQLFCTPKEFENSFEGFNRMFDWLKRNDVALDQSVICLEATGVYGEALAYCAFTKGIPIAVEPPLKVKRAFKPSRHKTDAVDSQQIAEYAFRFLDDLSFWRPKAKVIEQIKVLLNTREQLISQKTAHINALRSIRRKVVRTPLAEQVHQNCIDQIKQHIRAIEEEIRQLLDQNPDFRQLVKDLDSIPGVGFLLAIHMLILVETVPNALEYRKLASYLGICPYERRSGSSVYRKARSRHFGTSIIRKLLYLAAMSLRTHNREFRNYFNRKVLAGKPKQLVLNNIANKLLRIMCAVIRDQTSYIPEHRSLHPCFAN